MDVEPEIGPTDLLPGSGRMGRNDALVDSRRKGSVHERPLKRILLVDDDPDLRAAGMLILGDMGGYTVLTCSSAGEAVDQSVSFRPDLILLDVVMPGTDGFGTLKALRGLEATAEVPVVFMTAMVEPHEIARYQELGCLGVIPKPFEPVALAKTLEGLWGGHRGRVAASRLEEFEALRLAYLNELPRKIRAMRAAAAVLAAEGWDRSALESLGHLAHRMAGTSGLYRLSALSRSAGTLEDIVKRLLTGPTWPPSSSPAELAILVKAVDGIARSETRQARPSPQARGR
jgi:two-component system OmpR family response regulator